MNNEKFTDFYLALVSMLLHTKQQIIKAASSHGLTGMQSLTLLVISPEQTTTMHELADVFGCDASNVTGIIDGLEAKGLVSRQAKAGDRRVKVIYLEPKGVEVRNIILNEAAGKDGENFLGNLDSKEAETFVALVLKTSKSCSFPLFKRSKR